MKEEFLQFIWKHRHYPQQPLTTNSGEKVEIINPGFHNTDGGPDFFNAKIKIDDVLWVGNVEIHIRSSDWKKHKHHLQKSYDNVVLQVVADHDCAVHRTSGEEIPTIELPIQPSFLSRYEQLVQNEMWTACEDHIHSVDPFLISHWMTRLAMERLEMKSNSIIERLRSLGYDWEELVYQHLFSNFGFKLNALPFEQLAKSIPLKTLLRVRTNRVQTEALLFGQSGFLDGEPCDEYFSQLQHEYFYVKHKYKLTPVDISIWKHLRTRPLNFPEIRLAQLSDLFHTGKGLFAKLLQINKINDAMELFDLSPSTYWDTHYSFGKQTLPLKKKTGKRSIENVLINTVSPIIFVYGMQTDDNNYKQKALRLLEEVPSENNHIVRQWKKIGIAAKNALESQALIQLKNNYCDKKKCVNCQIGSKIITNYE